MGGFSQIIRIPRTDEDGSNILSQVTSTGGASKPLNVKIVATEGDAPYTVKLKHDRIGDLRVSNSQCSPEEWERILNAIFLNAEAVEGVEAGAEVESEKSIIITIRRRVAGISQRLGSITLHFKENEAIELFDWCDAAIQEREKFRADLRGQVAKAADLEARVTELRNQLDELIQAKKEREKEILEKMCRLLNEKKVKIRQQQRLLRTAKIDPDTKMEEDEDEDDSAIRHIPTASRPNKRKTRRNHADDDSSDDGFEKMDVDDPQPPPLKNEAGGGSDSGDERRTPDVNDEDDEDVTGREPEDEDSHEEDQPPTPPPKRDLRKTTPATASSSSARKGKGKERLNDSVAMHTRRREASTPPASSVPADTPADEDETESDDEL